MTKPWGFAILLLLCVVACAPAVKITPTDLTYAPKPKGCHIDVYYPGQTIPYQNKDIGYIKLGDTGFTIKCDREAMINLAKDKACSAGADAVHIHQIKTPDLWSTCYRLEARMKKYTSVKTVYKKQSTIKTTRLMTKQGALTNYKVYSLPQKPLNTPVRTTGVSNQMETKWAVIIGISNYKDTRIPSLRYASNDAQAFYNWAVSPHGGRYAPSNIKFLLNQEATGRKIKDALFIWLKQALAEDVVTIYFAGHGSPESPDSPDNLYLLCYDTDYQNIASTGFPMWDIETALL